MNLTNHSFSQNYQEIIELIKLKPFKTNIDILTNNLVNAKLNILKKLLADDIFYDFINNGDLVHGDFHNENLIYDMNDNVKYILDFEMMHKGHKLEDVMNFVLFACCNTSYAKEDIAKARYFIDAYRNYNFFTKEELVIAIHYSLYKLFKSFFIEIELYKKRNKQLVNLIARDLEKISYLDKNLDSFIDSLVK